PELTGFRDPFLWRQGGDWLLGVGSGVRKKGGRVLLYRSKDLREWKYLHPLASGQWTGRENVNLVDSGEMWECPDFFPLGSKHVLLYSTAGKVVWEVGELDPKELLFHPQRSGVLDHGAYYAQKTQIDAKGQRILWGWIPERRPEAEFSAAGWAGCMALPRLLTLNHQHDLAMQIAPQAGRLRVKALATLAFNTSAEVKKKTIASIEMKEVAGELAWQTASGSVSVTVRDDSGPWWWLNLEVLGSAM